MISESVAKRYVKALFGAASGSGEAEALAPLLTGLQGLYQSNKDLRNALANPRLPEDRKRAVLLRLAGEDAPALLQRFLSLLLAKRRIEVLGLAGSLYTQLVEAAAGVRHASVVTALPLTADQEQRLIETLSTQFGCQITLESSVDPAIIGGVAVKVGDVLIDGSIRHRLEQLREKVAGARA
jgi:F-type H+-transporting ATPase subunit delta